VKQAVVTVISNKRVAPGIYLIWLDAPTLAERAKPGQFVMVRCGEEVVLRRPLSLYRVDGEKLALLFMVRGKGTEWLAHQKRGDRLDIFGTLGNGFRILPESKSLLLVAGGTGIASLCFLAEKAVEGGKEVTLLAGASTKKLLLPQSLLPLNTATVVATEDGSCGHKGLVTDLLPQYAPATNQVIACGPLPMLRYMAKEQKKLGIRNKSVQVSLEMRMGCGVGVCYGCTIRTKHGLKQACKDGPVFELDDIIWDELANI
jgi:dihydroorotate dehydrogenase electron transfer subunit